MTAYALYIIDLDKIKTPKEYTAAMNKTPYAYFNKIRGIESYYNIKLRRERGGFSVVKDRTQYVALKITA